MTQYVISAAPMYPDGSIGDHGELVVESLGDPAVAVFLAAAAAMIGKFNDRDEDTPDAIDVTISRVYEEAA